MKKINLYFDFEFTGLSPDAQPISLGIVSDVLDCEKTLMPPCDVYNESVKYKDSKSFYAEFSDYDINRCDDWVKENVVDKLWLRKMKINKPIFDSNYEVRVGNTEWNCLGSFNEVKETLKKWLKQFSDYQITFVCDCGVWDWYWMVQLLAEWEEKENVFEYDETIHPSEIEIPKGFDMFHGRYVKVGLPKLPVNISPVPFDLNQLIAEKKGISVGEAFELNREELAFSESFNPTRKAASVKYMQGDKWGDEKHNALFDAKVIKEIYNKLK